MERSINNSISEELKRRLTKKCKILIKKTGQREVFSTIAECLQKVKKKGNLIGNFHLAFM